MGAFLAYAITGIKIKLIVRFVFIYCDYYDYCVTVFDCVREIKDYNKTLNYAYLFDYYANLFY